MNTKLNCLIGKHLKSTESINAEWSGYYPEIDQDGIIVSIIDADNVPDDMTMVDWSTNTIEGMPIDTEGEYGFEALM